MGLRLRTVRISQAAVLAIAMLWVLPPTADATDQGGLTGGKLGRSTGGTVPCRDGTGNVFSFSLRLKRVRPDLQSALTRLAVDNDCTKVATIYFGPGTEIDDPETVGLAVIPGADAVLLRHELRVAGLWHHPARQVSDGSLRSRPVCAIPFVDFVVRRSGTLARPRCASPSPDLRIELFWDNEADVDLHLLHPNGDWGTSPWDCYWANRNPNWGDLASEDDDPSLEVDDIDGFGPEVITLPVLEQVTYTVGALYFSYPGGADVPTTATVFIYAGGVLLSEMTTEIPEKIHFWTVAAVTWDGQNVTVTPIDEVTPA